MKKINYLGNSIEFSFNKPIEETGYIQENFDFINKTSYGTSGIAEILKYNNNLHISFIIGEIFKNLRDQAKIQKMDYLQVIIINNIEVWCIDNGDSICLMTKEEY